MDYIYKNIEAYNPNKKRKTLIVFDDMIADKVRNRKFNAIVIELFIRGKNNYTFLLFLFGNLVLPHEKY